MSFIWSSISTYSTRTDVGLDKKPTVGSISKPYMIDLCLMINNNTRMKNSALQFVIKTRKMFGQEKTNVQETKIWTSKQEPLLQ